MRRSLGNLASNAYNLGAAALSASGQVKRMSAWCSRSHSVKMQVKPDGESAFNSSKTFQKRAAALLPSAVRERRKPLFS
jgi:hypothetical protein